MIGLIFVAMTAVAVMAVLLPLARRRQIPQGGEVAVYRDQLAEIQQDLARGTIGAAEAEAARTEVARRLIAASETPIPAASSSAFRRRVVALAALVILPLLAAGLYFHLRPDLLDRSLTAGTVEDDDATLVVLVQRIEAELANRPEDGRGWDVLAPVYLRLGRAEDAATAYGNAIRLLGSTAEREAGLGEALTHLADGKVTPEAQQAFKRALELEPKQARSLFYLARAAEQQGDRVKAADIYRGMLADAPEAPYAGAVRAGLARVALGEEGQVPAIDPKALENVSPDERLATIRGMVDGLAMRLKEDPHDLGGQLRLIRAWVMLGETDKAKAAATDARGAFANDPAAQRRIADLLLGLGLGG